MLHIVINFLLAISALSAIITCYIFFIQNRNWKKIAIASIFFALLLIIYSYNESGKKSKIQVSQTVDSVLSKPVSLPSKSKGYYADRDKQGDTQTVQKKVMVSPSSTGTTMNASSSNVITVSGGGVINNQGGIINQQNTGSQK